VGIGLVGLSIEGLVVEDDWLKRDSWVDCGTAAV